MDKYFSSVLSPYIPTYEKSFLSGITDIIISSFIPTFKASKLFIVYIFLDKVHASVLDTVTPTLTPVKLPGPFNIT